jgi:circadian clock protein KaiB
MSTDPAPKGQTMQLRLYVAGDGPNSVAARANLRRILAAHSDVQATVEVVDCFEHPARVLEDGVLVTPTLVRVQPPPERTIIGSLSETDRVVAALELPVNGDAGGQAGG